mmetsp:Transcript_15245/g.28956  ORF Transcript_15245/g.28956 Transcript_15245/m.28956 type:complete len:206 (+) Transcript_15245:3-620(+)
MIVSLKNAASTTQFDQLLLCCLFVCLSNYYMIVQHCFGGGGGGGTLRRGGRGGTGSIGISRILGFGLCFFLGFVRVVDTVLSSPAMDASPLRSACFWFLKARLRVLSSSSKGKFRSMAIFFRLAENAYGKSMTVPEWQQSMTTTQKTPPFKRLTNRSNRSSSIICPFSRKSTGMIDSSYPSSSSPLVSTTRPPCPLKLTKTTSPG